MPRPRKRSVHSKLRDARYDLSEANARLAYTETLLSSARDSAGALLGQRDAANTRANEAETHLADAEFYLRRTRETLTLVSRGRDALRDSLGKVLDDQKFFQDQAFQLARELETAQTQLRQMQALATVTAVKAILEVSPAEAMAFLSEGAVRCGVDADDVVTSAKAILPNAYRLGVKACVDVATAPPPMTDFLIPVSEFSSRYIPFGQ